MPLLEYSSWQKFKNVLLTAQVACENTDHELSDHFIKAATVVPIGSNTKREIEDTHLSRCGCYLVVQNAKLNAQAKKFGLLLAY